MSTAAALRSARITVLAAAASLVTACSGSPLEPGAAVTPRRARAVTVAAHGRQVGADSTAVRVPGGNGQGATTNGPTWPWY